MGYKESIQKEIKKIQEDGTKLYSYLYDLAYKAEVDDLRFLENVFNSFLSDERSEIKRVSIYGLLFALKIRNIRYKRTALQYLEDDTNDFSLRLMCVSGLAEAYMGTEDLYLVKLFYFMFNKADEDDDIRTECFVGLMKLLGLSSVEMMRKNQNRVIISFNDINMTDFLQEINKIEQLVSF